MGRAERWHTHLTSPWLRRGLVSAALLAALALWVEPQAIAAEVRRFAAEWVVLALVISTLQVMLCAWRWQFTAGLIDVPLRFAYALREYYLALLVNQLLPGGVLGDAGRAHRHASQAHSKGRAWRAVIIERASGQVAVVVLTLMALLLSPLWHAALGGALITVVGLSAFATLAAVGVSGWLLRQRFGLWLARLPHWCQALARDLRRGLLRRGVWPQQLLSSLVIVLSYGLVMVCAARAIGVALPALQVLALTPVLLLAMLIPFSVAGWGLREGAAAGVWALVGLPPAQGVAVSLAYGVLVLLASLPGIWVALSRRANAQPSNGGIPQPQVEQGVVTTAESARGRAQRTLKGLNGRHFQPGSAGANQQRSDQQMQSVNGARLDKLRHRNTATLDQHPRQALCGQQVDNIMGGELTVAVQRQYTAFNVGQARRCRQLRPYLFAHNMQRRRAIAIQQRQVAGNTTAGIQHHARRVSTADVAHGQLRIIGAGGSRADDHGIDQGAQAVQMNQAFMAIDVVGVAALRGDAAIQTLPQLGHYPCRSTGQRRQAVKQLPRLGGDGLSGLPLAGWRQGDRYTASVPMTQRQQPLPGIGQRNRVDIGVGHDASVLKNPPHHAGAIGASASSSGQPFVQFKTNSFAQACATPLVRTPGGLHVPD